MSFCFHVVKDPDERPFQSVLSQKVGVLLFLAKKENIPKLYPRFHFSIDEATDNKVKARLLFLISICFLKIGIYLSKKW